MVDIRNESEDYKKGLLDGYRSTIKGTLPLKPAKVNDVTEYALGWSYAERNAKIIHRYETFGNKPYFGLE